MASRSYLRWQGVVDGMRALISRWLCERQRGQSCSGFDGSRRVEVVRSLEVVTTDPLSAAKQDVADQGLSHLSNPFGAGYGQRAPAIGG